MIDGFLPFAKASDETPASYMFSSTYMQVNRVHEPSIPSERMSFVPTKAEHMWSRGFPTNVCLF